MKTELGANSRLPAGVHGDCTCRALATLADGSVVSNAYGYYCKGMDIGRVEVVVTADRSVKIIDKHSRED